MAFDHALLSESASRFATVLGMLVFLLAIVRAPWRQLLAVGTRQHVLFAVAGSLAVLWSISFHPQPGVTLHYLGMTAATAILGWSFAVIAGALALVVLWLTGQVQADVLPLTWLLTAVAPATAVTLLLHLLERSRVRNLFVFLLGVGYGGGMLAALALVIAALLTLAGAGRGDLVAMAFDHVALLPLFLFSEGFINGAALTTITVYFPGVVRGFNEDRFLGGD